MREINCAWLEGRVDDLGRVVHPEIVIALPGFAGRARGSPDFVLGFKEIGDCATSLQFVESDQQIDLTGHTAVLTFRYDMLSVVSG